jgi:hypothetical protein
LIHECYARAVAAKARLSAGARRWSFSGALQVVSLHFILFYRFIIVLRIDAHSTLGSCLYSFFTSLRPGFVEF